MILHVKRVAFVALSVGLLSAATISQKAEASDGESAMYVSGRYGMELSGYGSISESPITIGENDTDAAMPATASVSLAVAGVKASAPTISYLNGYSVAGAIGLAQNGGFREEVELMYMSRAAKADSIITYARSAVPGDTVQILIPTQSAAALMFNLYYDIVNGSNFSPFIGVGGGAARMYWGSNIAMTTLGYQLKAGMTFALSPSTLIYASGHYFNTLSTKVLLPKTAEGVTFGSNVLAATSTLTSLTIRSFGYASAGISLGVIIGNPSLD